jgi:protein TonB
MHPRLHVTKFLGISFALHALVIIAALLLARSGVTPPPFVLPVNIVNLPPQMLKNLPPVQQPSRIAPEKIIPPGPVPVPKKFGTGNEVSIPKLLPRSGVPEGAEQGTEHGKGEAQTPKEIGPLPFLTQRDIDELARKGMPAKKPGDDSVTLDTDEFKFISYNRWLKIKVESVLHYPELAAVSGLQGTLFIKFDIMKDGSLGGLELLKSSGYKILDDEALRAIRASAPFQQLPDDWNMDRYSIRAAVIFYLGEGYLR